jgi:hypothetical protein
MATFVLNENVAIAATTWENERGERDLTCVRLVQGILGSPQHRLAWSHAVYARWSAQIQRLRAQGNAIEPTFMSLLALVQRDAGKCPVPDGGDPPVLPEEASWSSKLQDDRDFLRLAAYFQGILATTDEPLQRDVVDLGIDVRYGFQVLFPNECLALL